MLKQAFYYWMPVVLYCLAIFIQSSLPPSDSIPLFFGADKLLHFCGYFVLGTLFFRALKVSNKETNLGVLAWYSIFFATAYGISDEIHQYFVPSRCAELFDVAADGIGGAFGVWGFYWYSLKHS